MIDKRTRVAQAIQDLKIFNIKDQDDLGRTLAEQIADVALAAAEEPQPVDLVEKVKRAIDKVENPFAADDPAFNKWSWKEAVAKAAIEALRKGAEERLREVNLTRRFDPDREFHYLNDDQVWLDEIVRACFGEQS